MRSVCSRAEACRPTCGRTSQALSRRPFRAGIPRSCQRHTHNGRNITFTVRVDDSNGQSATQQFTIRVLP
jgi:hypothetical protein